MLTEEVLKDIAPRLNKFLDRAALIGAGAEAVATIILMATDDATFEQWVNNDPGFELGLLWTESILNKAGIDTGNGQHEQN